MGEFLWLSEFVAPSFFSELNKKKKKNMQKKMKDDEAAPTETHPLCV